MEKWYQNRFRRTLLDMHIEDWNPEFMKLLFMAQMQHGVGFDNPHLFEILAGIESALSQKGYGLIIKRVSAGELYENFNELLHSEYADGAILHASAR